MFNKRIGIFILMLGLIPAAWAGADSDIETRINEALAEMHPTSTLQWWHDLGPSAPSIMIQMYTKTQRVYYKLRLLGGLGAFPEDPQTVAFIKSQAEQTNQGVVRETAIRALSSKSELDYVSKFLVHADPDTRLAAAETIRGMDDPHAQETFQHYLAGEKMSWVANKLKGEKPRPASLPIVASSEDRVSATFSGKWRGFWVAPNEESGKLQSLTAELFLQSLDASAVKAELSLYAGSPGGAPLRHFSIARAEGKGSKLHGKLRLKGETAFTLDLSDASGAPMLVLSAPASGVSVVLQKVDRE